jgi:CheY-specific phosphatase CheX
MKNLKAAMMASISEVLETMFFMSLDFDAQKTLKNIDIIQNEITMACRLDFTGPFSGCFLLIIPEKLLAEMSQNFMGLEQVEIKQQHLEGTIKELTNMIAGNTFSTLNDQIEFNLSIPELIDIQTLSSKYMANSEKGVEIITETTSGFLAVKTILNDK